MSAAAVKNKVSKVTDLKAAKAARAKKAVAGKERLMSVLLAPHVTEKTSQAQQNQNQYTFLVRRDSTRTEVRAAVELMFGVKVVGVMLCGQTPWPSITVCWPPNERFRCALPARARRARLPCGAGDVQ